jgi:excisionase family DNA binding protein
MSESKLAFELNDLPWGRTTTYKLINSGQLRAVKVGRKTLILAADLEACLRNLEAIQARTGSKGLGGAEAGHRER